MSDAKLPIAVLGAGSWGTALAALLARHGYPTVLWGRNAEQIAAIDRGHENRRYLPIGYLPENHRFPTYFTGAGMLDLYGSLSGMDGAARQRRIPELLELVGLDKWGDVRLGKYSKGMLQRVGLAQALLHEPKLLILDEPTDGVDPVGRIQIRQILQALEAKGVTVFINSHQLAEVETFCRDVAILHKGKVALTGRVKDLTATKGFRLTARQVPEALQSELGGVASGEAAVSFQIAIGACNRHYRQKGYEPLIPRASTVARVQASTSSLVKTFCCPPWRRNAKFASPKQPTHPNFYCESGQRK